jgi:FkbM family methyltransferase
MSIKKITRWAWPHIRQFRLYVDVGAHTGDTCVGLPAPFEETHAFEPNPSSFAQLQQLSNIHAYQVALGDQNINTTLVQPHPNHPDWSSCAAARIDLWKQQTVHENTQQFDVQMRTLDSYQFENVDFLKIDVEQGEWGVIQGAQQTILRCRPCIMLENKRDEAQQAVNWLLTQGYTQKHYGSDTVLYCC